MSLSTTHRVIVNAEGQHCLQFTSAIVPPTWQAAGFEGAEKDCIDFVRSVWKDIRPRSVQQFTCQHKAQIAVVKPEEGEETQNSWKWLMGEHSASLTRYTLRGQSQPNPELILKHVKAGFLLVQHQGTRPQERIELGMSLDKQQQHLTETQHAEGKENEPSTLTLTGNATVDGQSLRISVTLKTPAFIGTARAELLA
eukprot:m.5607 g.5607  ORF g.5607 m.5607 type:complete len:197 (-) comp4565_c0_seq2:18-608(-)